MRTYSTKNKKYVLISLAIIIISWEITSHLVGNQVILPSIGSIVGKLSLIVGEAGFWKITISSILRGLYSFIIAIILAFVIGWIGAFNEFVYNFMLPIMGILKSVPTMAFIVLALIWMKKENAPILIGIVIGFPLFYEMVLGGITNADDKLLKMMKSYGVNKKKIFYYVYLPSILFSIIPSLSSTLCLILKVVIAGELYGQPSYGIGAQINIEKLSLNTDAIIGWIIIVGVISVFIDFLVNIINKKLFIWKGIE